LRARPDATPAPWVSFVPQHVAEDILRHPHATPIGREQRFEAAALFADISGFTAMSEALGRVGRRGTEELTALLNAYFEPMIDVIHSYGGTVGKFGGDAMTVLFPVRGSRSAAARRAVRCALAMQAETTRHTAISTSAGTFGLALKTGLALDRVLCTSVGDPAVRLEYVIAGRALDLSTEAEHLATSGEVVAHSGLLDHCRGAVLARRRNGFATVEGLERPPPRVRPPELPDPDPTTRTTFAAYLHPSIAERLETGLDGFVNEHRKVTVLFVGFTGFDYDDDPDVTSKLQAYLARAVEVVHGYDGHLRQVEMGDKGSKFIVFFGAPVLHEDDETRALRCALDLRDLTEGPIRIGVASGFTFCGRVGSDRRQEYAAVGDTVNLAARLMQAAAPGEILVAGGSVRTVAGTVRLETREPIVVKGKSEPVPLSALVGQAADAPAHTFAEPVYALPMIGREPELAIARATLDLAALGSGHVLGIAGEPGIGKSRFGAELLRTAAERGLATFAGACQSYGSSIAYLPWQQIWRAILELDGNESVTDQLAQLERAVVDLDPSLVPRLPLLAPVLRLPIPDNALTAPLDAELRAELLRVLLLDALRRRADSGPIILVLEDCHWLDSLSRSLLAFIARNIATLPVLVVAVYRLADDGAATTTWAHDLDHFTELHLQPLAADQVDTLVAAKVGEAFGRTDVVPEAVAQLVGRAEGNPFHVEELINLLRDRGIDLDDDKAVAAAELPDTLYGLVMARIDQLAELDKTTVKVASVVGRSFRASWLSGSAPMLGGDRSVRRSLEGLARTQLIALARQRPELEYLFRHVTTRDVAYESLPFSLRQELHERVAMYVETAYAPNLEQYVDTLAYHFGLSANADKKRVYLRLAGDAAKAGFSNAAAIEHYEQLLPLVEASDRSGVLRSLGEVKEHVGDWSGAEDAYREGLVLAESAGNPRDAAECRRSHGALLAHQGSFAPSRSMLEQAKEESEAAGDPAGVVRALEALAFVAWEQSDHAGSLEYSREHLRRAEDADDRIGISMAVEQMGLVYWHRGEHEAAKASFEHALEVATSVGYVRGVIHASNDLAGLYWEQGDHSRAFEHVRDGLAAARKIGYRHAAGVLLGNAAELCRQRGELATALALSRRALEIAAELGARRGIASRVGNMALVLSAQGRKREAELLFDRAIALAREVESPYFLCEYLHHSAELLAGQERWGEATDRNSEALEVARAVDRRNVRVPAELLSVRLRRAADLLEQTEAEATLERLANEWTEPAEQAAVKFELWQLNGSEAARNSAAELYRTLHAATPNAIYRERYASLTGHVLPAPSPLPRLIDDMEAELDVAALLRTVEGLKLSTAAPVLAGG
jgi:class 3 adenylate cyclase/tetratricopeptide (TPR) repeat protein